MWWQRIPRWLCPLPEGYAESGKSLQELLPTYRKWDYVALALWLVLLPVATVAWAFVLDQVSALVASRFPKAIFQMRCSGWMWIAAGLLPGALSAGVLASRLVRWFLKSRYAEYDRYSNLATNVNGGRTSAWLFSVASAAGLLLTLSLLHWRAVFTKDDLTIYPFLSLSSTTYRYQDVVDIRTSRHVKAPNGRVLVNSERIHVIEFADGRRWSTYLIWEESEDAAKDRLLKFLCDKSGKQVRQVPVLEDG